MTTTNETLSTFKIIVHLIIALLISNPLQAESLLIRDVHIIPSNQTTSLADTQNVLIKDGSITAIGQELYPADKQLLGNGQFLIPGLIDSHVHLSGIPGVISKNQPFDTNIITNGENQIPKSYLYFGFTSVLDLASLRETIDEWNQQDLRPDAYHCVPAPIPNGYPLAWDPDTQYDGDLAKFIFYDKRQAKLTPKHITPKDHSAKAIAKRAKDDGALCIKIFYETGFGPLKDLPVPNKAMVNALVNETHKLGLLVFMHGNSEEAYRFGIDTNIDVLAHGMWHWDQLDLTSDNALRSFIKSASLSKIAFQPTIQVIYGEQELFNPNYFSNKNVMHAIPSNLISWYQSAQGQWMKNKMKNFMENLSDDPLDQYKEFSNPYKIPIKRVSTLARLFDESNVPLIFGSDTPSGPFYTQFPGINGYLEIQRWAEAGISLNKIFTALTIDNAKRIGLDHKLGSIEIGKTAHLLLLNKNPLQTIEAYDSIDTVILHGKPIKRGDLSALNIPTNKGKNITNNTPH